MTTRRDSILRLAPVALLVLGLGLAGCGSDPQAPQDPEPTLTQDDVAWQAAFVAKAASVVAPEIIKFANKSDKDTYYQTYNGPTDGIDGTVRFDYFVDGTPSPKGAANEAHVFTETASGGLSVYFGFGGQLDVTFDMDADLDQALGTADVLGTGTFASGPFSATFSCTNLVVSETVDYPLSGTLTFVSGPFSVDVVFDGDMTAMIEVDGTPIYEVDFSGALNKL